VTSPGRKNTLPVVSESIDRSSNQNVPRSGAQRARKHQRSFVSLRLNWSCAMTHLLEKKFRPMQDEKGKFRKEIVLVN
jgi:hypothetical protein